MKKIYVVATLLLCLLVQVSYSQVLRPFAPRYSNPSIRGNIVYVSNSIISSAGVGIGTPGTGELPPSGTTTNNSKLGINIDVDGVQPDSVIKLGANWKYLSDDTRPAGWETTGYNDAAWASGAAELGYGDGDEATCIPSGGGGTLCAPTGTKYMASYFRKTINITNPALFANFSLDFVRDDGIVVYVNGVEVVRDNMPAGAIVHGTPAASNISGGAESALNLNTIPASYFVSGNNTIAVEIHQDGSGSSDLSFNLQLIGNPIGTVTMIPYGSNWKYLDNNTRPAGWETTAYSDAGWAAGNAQLGYGDGDETTVVSYGGIPGNKFITTYFRKTINIANPSLYTSILVNLIRDDGAVIYVNGVEAVRENMPAGPIAHGTFAASTIGGASESTPVQYFIPSSYFVSGNNTIAVEIHQDAVTSSDISFDMELLGTTDSTFNSSSADLNLTSCSSVLFAGLYWGAGQGVGGSNTGWITGENTCKIKLPGAANYTTVTASNIDYWNNTLIPGYAHSGFQSFANITSIVNSVINHNGTYMVANVTSPVGIEDAYGGWTLVIVYADPALPVRNLTVFDGCAGVQSSSGNVDVTVTGFLTPPTGPVSCELGAIAYDGDRGPNDAFEFRQAGAPLFYNLTPNAAANLNDMWNSSISYKGVSVATRNPAFHNTLGYDADIIEVPNAGNAQLGNIKNSAVVRFSSPNENYLVTLLTTSISNYNPIFGFEKTAIDLNGGTLNPGDQLRYRLNYQNDGNDASINNIIRDKIPAGATYVPGSLKIQGVSKTDAAGDDEAEYDFATNTVIFRVGAGANAVTGGALTVNGAGSRGNVVFDVYTPSSCAVVSCGGSIRNSARMDYTGVTSGSNLYDSSGVDVAGCVIQGPVISTLSPSCYNPVDTVLANGCPTLSVTLPYAKYGGYTFYNSTNFIPANIINPYTAITSTRVVYAYYDGGPGCKDTIRLNIYISGCPDIDKDKDGIPDYVEINIPLALQDHNSNGIPNWKDPLYPGYVDYNLDGVNDNFDPSADADNDGTPNFYDHDFPGYIDTNGDGVNDNMDKDLDGIPNHLDRDSDNDGIPDTVESFGVDADGDGRIDNFTDPDNDGLSQNVDASAGGVLGSGNGLGAIDTDGDGIPNYLDLDSDNDGIPDVVEAYGADVNNDGKIDGYSDSDGDGYADALDADVGNDNVMENPTGPLLKTGADTNADGRADSYPNKNMDADSKPNPYDLDSDGDGITDVKEAQFTDANWDGQVDGAINANGRNTALAALGSLGLPNTDGTGRANPYDIDSDDDGIPDNVEGQTTLGYALPSGTDSDGDGIDNSYDNYAGFGGDGVHFPNTDADAQPDYLDDDTDGDGLIDRIEGNDFNLNGNPDDLVTLTGVDTDGDGLDNRFDNNNASAKGTSAYMGNGGIVTGDATPGSTTMVQHTAMAFGCATERDWRCLPYVLSCEFVTFQGSINQQQVPLQWTALCKQEVDYFIVERSTDREHFTETLREQGNPKLNEIQSYAATDNIAGQTANVFYYRLRSVMKTGKEILSDIITIKRNGGINATVKVMPNPVKDRLQLAITSPVNQQATIYILDGAGRAIHTMKRQLVKGQTLIVYPDVATLAEGVYYIKVSINDNVLTSKFSKVR